MSELKGKIKFISEVQSGTSKAGKEWKKLLFVISNNEGYEGQEQIFAFDVFGDEKVDSFLQYNSVGKEVEVSYNIRTNEHQGKYFTSLQSWKVFGVQNDGNAVQEPVVQDDASDILPF